MSKCYVPTLNGEVNGTCLKCFKLCDSQLTRHGNVHNWTVSVVSTDLLSVIPQENSRISGL
jgi:hypothetical protein